MKKNILTRGILLLILVALLAIGFTGCGSVYPTTGTVVIYISGSYTGYNYNIYLDGSVTSFTPYGSYLGTTWGGTFTATNITPGYHTFKAVDSAWNWYWDADSVYVTAGGTSYVYLSPW